MEFFKNNKFIILLILVLSACGYVFLYITEEKNENILVEAEIETVEKNIEETIQEKTKIYVDIAGEILNPGVYVLDEGSRVNDLIISAVTSKRGLADSRTKFQFLSFANATLYSGVFSRDW